MPVNMEVHGCSRLDGCNGSFAFAIANLKNKNTKITPIN